MSLLIELKNKNHFTDTEQNICKYLLEYPEKISKLTARELGELTFSSAASVVRFCKKLGFSNYMDFKLQFSLELKSKPELDNMQKIEISDRENIVSMIQKVHTMQIKALEETKKRLSLAGQTYKRAYYTHKNYMLFFYINYCKSCFLLHPRSS